MSESFGRLRRFLRELKRRNVYKVAVAYLAVAFVGLQAARLLVPATTLPGWADQLFIFLAVAGFPVAIVLAWAFEMTAEGVRRTPGAEGQETGGSIYQWIGLAVVVLIAGGVWYSTAEDGSAPSSEATATTDTASRTVSTAADSTAVAISARDRPFVAVLPLENLSPKEENKFFAAGVHEEILTQLSKVSGLGVFARTTMEEYADSEKSVYEIGRELGAEAVLEGSVRRAAGRVRISAQLIDPQSRDHVWSQTYERQLSPEAMFDIQANIAQKIAGALETQLTSSEQKRIESAPTEDLAAYDAYLKGRSQIFRHPATGDPAHVDASIEHLREAVRRDSTFAQAHAWLGLAYALRTVALGGADRWLDSAAVYVERAKAIDPEVAQAYLAESWIHDGHDSTAVRVEALRRAVELQPSHAYATAMLGNALRSQGKHAEAVRVARRAVQLAPRRPIILWLMAGKLVEVGLYDAAEAWSRRILEIEPSYLFGVRSLAIIQRLRDRPEEALRTWERYLSEQTGPPNADVLEDAADAALAAGQPERAKAWLERIPEVRRQDTDEASPVQAAVPRNPEARAALGWAELQGGNGDRGRELLNEVADTLQAQLERGEGGPATRVRLAEVQAALGRTERALRHLERWRSSNLDLYSGGDRLLISPMFEPLRSEPRYRNVVDELQAKRRQARDQVLEADLDLYPPGAEPDSAGGRYGDPRVTSSCDLSPEGGPG